MQKTILITGSTDGIGLATAKKLVTMGHKVLLHGRDAVKLEQAEKAVSGLMPDGPVEAYLADLSRMSNVEALADAIIENHDSLDVLINNAGVFKSSHPTTLDGLDVRFAVNTLAPYLLTKKLMPLLGPKARVINLSSAAQSPVDLQALAGKLTLSDEFKAYAQSKLAITMWSRHMALSLKDKGPVIIAVNPGSLLATKMVKEGFNMTGNDINIGTDILTRLALDEEYSTASGKYFDNDSRQFSSPHNNALDPQKSQNVVRVIETILNEVTTSTFDTPPN